MVLSHSTKDRIQKIVGMNPGAKVRFRPVKAVLWLYMYLDVFGICTADIVYFLKSAMVNRMGVKFHSLTYINS